MKKNDAIKRLAEIKKEIPELEKIINSFDPLDVTSYKEVCEKLGDSEITEEDVKFLPVIERKKAMAKLKIGQLERFYNCGVKPNWSDHSDYKGKHYPYFTINGHGRLRFCDSTCRYGYFGGAVGLYKDKETSDHVGKHHIDIYRDLM